MTRWIWFTICAAAGLGMLVCGLLVPVYLQAVDVSVVQKAGRDTPGLIARGLELAGGNNLGAAQLVFQAAQTEGIQEHVGLGQAITNLTILHPEWQAWGGGETRLEKLFATGPGRTNSNPEPFTEFIVRLENREKALEILSASPHAEVQELLRCRALTNTVIFSPSQSSSGQAFDAALCICGLLIEDDRLTPELRHAAGALALDANLGRSPQALEQTLLDFMSLGQRLNWNQLGIFTGRIKDAATLHSLADMVRKPGDQLPVLFAAVELSGGPGDVARFLANFSQTGSKDLGASLQFGAGGVNELLSRDQRLTNSGFRRRLAAYDPFGAFFNFASDYSWRAPRLAMAMKWLMYLAGGFFVAMAFHFAKPAVSSLERPLQVRGFHVAREFLFALGFLFVVLLLSEPFLAQESQKVDVPFRLRLPMAGGAVRAGSAIEKPNVMNQTILLTLLLFFVLQGLIYVSCIVKLAEIRRQKVPPRIKLKLLENEDHLFDAGLYLGFVGTIISLILVSMRIIEFSLMAAYSSTSFGIVFVCVFKIFHLRPARRKLLLEAETASAEPAMRAAPRPLAPTA